MDRLKNMQQRQLLFLAGGVSFVIIILLLFLTGGKKNTPSTSFPNVSPNPTRVPLPTMQMEQFQSKEFGITYPHGWNPTGGQVLGGGTLTVIESNSKTASMKIQSTPFNQGNRDTTESMYDSFKFVKSATLVSGVTAMKFEGNFGKKTEVAYLFQYYNNLYQIVFDNDKTDTSENYQEVFSIMLQSFHLVTP